MSPGGARIGCPAPRRVAVLRALQLGDMLCAVPALRALRAGLPDAHITLVGLPWARTFADRFSHYVDDLLVLPGYPGLPEMSPDVRALPGFLAAAQARRFDLAVQMHGSGTITNPLLELLGANRTAGFYTPGGYVPDPDRFLPYPEDQPEIRRALRLVEFLGLPPLGEHLELPLCPEDSAALANVSGARGLRPGDYVCIHPGARAADRRWSPLAFARVADALGETGLQVVLTGAKEEADVTRAVADATRRRPLDLTGQTTLGALAALFSRARLLVCNDTGVSHVAVALGTPSVVLFTGSDPARWAPLNTHRHRPIDGRSPTAVSDAIRAALDVMRDGQPAVA